MITAAIFDLFGTLVPHVDDSAFAASLGPTAEAMGIERQCLVDALCGEERFLEWMTGAADTHGRMRRAFALFGLQPDNVRIARAAETRHDAHRQWLEPLPTAVDTLASLKRMGIRCGLMSMCSGEVPELWDSTPFAVFFAVAHFSCCVGLTKADEAFYTMTLEALDAEPSETVYVGDSRGELEWARRLGMMPVQRRRAPAVEWDGVGIDEPGELIPLIRRLNESEVRGCMESRGAGESSL